MRNAVAERRRALGLTQTELAAASRLSRPLISAVETDRHV
ncbi:MAG: helix-turn-helix domain-containing protein, partial [Actinomycetota bacterium]